MNILFVSEYFYPRTAGGEVWSFELCKELVRRGHSVTVITSDNGAPCEAVVEGISILRPTRLTSRIGNRAARWWAARKLESFVDTYVGQHAAEIDVIHIMAFAINVGVSKIAKKHNIRSITSVHSFFGEAWLQLSKAGPVLRWLEQRAIIGDESDLVQVPSKYLQQQIVRATGKNAVVIHNWIAGDFPPAIPAESTLVFVGSLERIKQPLACIAVAKKLSCRLIVIGEGSLEKDLHRKAKNAGVDLQHLKNVSRNETLRVLGGASLVLVPSVTESFSLVALEAAAQGTPVSGNAVGILTELPGIVAFPPDDIPPRISKQAQEKIRKQFSLGVAVAQFEELYERVRRRK